MARERTGRGFEVVEVGQGGVRRQVALLHRGETGPQRRGPGLEGISRRIAAQLFRGPGSEGLVGFVSTGADLRGPLKGERRADPGSVAWCPSRMPEYPDVTVYLEALAPRDPRAAAGGRAGARPSLVRTADPPLRTAFGKRVLGLRRLGKRLVLVLEDDLFLVIHLMIAGRLHWKERGAPIPGADRTGGVRLPRRHAHSHRGQPARSAPSSCSSAGKRRSPPGPRAASSRWRPRSTEFAAALRRENHTLKRTLTDPRLFSGIGNAYSDEILHAARLSPVALSQRLDDDEVERLYRATRSVLEDVDRPARAQRRGRASRRRSPPSGRRWRSTGGTGSRAPTAAHRCSASCTPRTRPTTAPRCQTAGKLLADRSLSRLLKEDWPRTLEELEESRAATRERMLGSEGGAPPAPTTAAPRRAGPPPTVDPAVR